MSHKLIYDGHCPFCTAQAANIKRLAGESITLESFQDPAVLAKYPELTREDCMKEIKLKTKDGRLMGGAEAIFFALSLYPLYRPLRWIYPIPGLKQIFDWGYAWVAKNRYKIQSKDCPNGTCAWRPEVSEK